MYNPVGIVQKDSFSHEVTPTNSSVNILFLIFSDWSVYEALMGLAISKLV